MPDRNEEIEARINKAIANRDTEDLDRLLSELYQPAKSATESFTPAIELTPAARRGAGRVSVRGAAAVNWANQISRAKRRIKYDIKTGFGFGGMRIVSEGDSWFQYPLRLRDIIDSLMDDEDKAVLSLDAAGDVVANMAAEAEYLSALEETRAHAFLLSAGGNDLLGDGAFAAVLKRYSEGANAEDLLDEAKFGKRLDTILADYRKIIGDVSKARPDLAILSHGYDIAHPVKGGKWLGAPLEKMGIPLKLGREVVGLVVNAFNDALSKLAQEFPSYRHVDLRNVVDGGAASWFDELHPNDAGYERAADAFREVLRDTIKPVRESTTFVLAQAETFFCETRDELETGHLETSLAAAPVKPTVDRVVTTPHRSSRNGTRIDRIVIHYTTSRNIDGSISWFKNPASRVSAHYIVGRDGELVQVVSDNERAWHAGNSNMNARSIGIEHVAADGDEITDEQAATSAQLIDWLMAEYDIAKSGVIPHCCVKSTSCCGDLFKAFGGGRTKKCDEQRDALHAWMASRNVTSFSIQPASGVEMAAGDDDEPDHAIRGDRIVDEIDDGARYEPSFYGSLPARSWRPPRSDTVRASATALRIAASLREISRPDRSEEANDVDEFRDVEIGIGLDLARLDSSNLEMAAAEVDELFSVEALAAFDYAAFERYIVDTLGIQHFKPVEFLFLGASNASGPCKARNALPDKALWPNIGKTARMLDRIRIELGAPIRILSAYRNQAYNTCISGAGGSFHKKFNAIDWRCDKGTVGEWRAAAQRVRESSPEFKGGIGFYPGQKFIHIDTRGWNANWGAQSDQIESIASANVITRNREQRVQTPNNDADTRSRGLVKSPTRYKLRFPGRDALQDALASPELETTQRRRTDWKRHTLIVDMESGAGPEEATEKTAEFAKTVGAKMIPDLQYEIDSIIVPGPESPDDPTLDDVTRMIGARRVWDRTRGKGITIAVVDTGVHGSRNEFSNKQHLHSGLPSPGFDTAWDDVNGHGTMCAAIAAGEGGKGTARNGIAPEASILPCRSNLRASEIVLIYDQLIDRAKRGERIVATNSFGLAVGEPPPPPEDTDLFDVLVEAEAAGIHIFFSAGNNHEATGASHTACGPNSIWLHKSHDFLMAVGACDLDRSMWSYSSRGPGQHFGAPRTNRKPDLIAPTPENGRIAYGEKDRTLTRGWGTSGACPQVAGLAALLLSMDHQLTPANVRQILRDSCNKIANIPDECQGAGMIDCERAVARLAGQPRRRRLPA